jgi:outer membrane beta-barrel protein
VIPATPARVLAAAAALAAAALPCAARASKADAFEGKIQPVSGQLYRKAGRVELTLGGALSFNDAFFSKRFGSAKLGYHLSESVSVHGFWQGGQAVATDSTMLCNRNTGCTDASQEQLYRVPGRISSIVGGEVQFSPFYGKLNLLGEKVAHFDLSVMLGPDWITHDRLVDVGVTTAPGKTTSLGGHVGLGARLFFSQAIALRLEVKDYVYQVTVPVDQNRKDIQNQLFAEMGVSVFFPFRNREQ